MAPALSACPCLSSLSTEHHPSPHCGHSDNKQQQKPPSMAVEATATARHKKTPTWKLAHCFMRALVDPVCYLGGWADGWSEHRMLYLLPFKMQTSLTIIPTSPAVLYTPVRPSVPPTSPKSWWACHMACHMACHIVCHMACHMVCQMACHMVCHMATNSHAALLHMHWHQHFLQATHG